MERQSRYPSNSDRDKLRKRTSDLGTSLMNEFSLNVLP